MTAMPTTPPSGPPSWESLTPDQQQAEWARYLAAQGGPPPAPKPAKRGRMPWYSWALAGVAVLVIGGIALVGAFTPNTIVLSGTMTVYGSSTAYSSAEGATCYTSGGFSDIGKGATVTVRDATGDIVATGALSDGTDQDVRCVFSYTIGDVPESTAYTVEVAKRGALTYSADDVRRGNVRQELRSWY